VLRVTLMLKIADVRNPGRMLQRYLQHLSENWSEVEISECMRIGESR
jgi:hypothetical protein